MECLPTISALNRYERPASANPASSFSFAGDAAASGTHATPQLPGSNVPGQQHDPPPPDEAQGPIVTCHCGLACNRLEAKTEKNMGRCAFLTLLFAIPRRAGC